MKQLSLYLITLVATLPAWSQTITTVAGNSSWTDIQNVAVDTQGNIYAADAQKHLVYKTDRLGATTTIAGNNCRILR
jgi:hypothetical protein